MQINYQTTQYHPTKAHDKDAAWDLHSNSEILIPSGSFRSVTTGIKLGIPPGHAGLIISRSGLASKGVFVLNSPGLLDPGYSGEVKIILANYNLNSDYMVHVGDRVAQLLITRTVDAYLSPGVVWESDRGENGFGSTGN
jgi:dUTP pyrophosphatase